MASLANSPPASPDEPSVESGLLHKTAPQLRVNHSNKASPIKKTRESTHKFQKLRQEEVESQLSGEPPFEKYELSSEKTKPAGKTRRGPARMSSTTERSERLRLKFERNRERRIIYELKDPEKMLKMADRILNKPTGRAENDGLPRVKFGRTAFASEMYSDGLEEHVLFPIFNIMKLSEGGRIRVSESEFQDFVALRYVPLRYYTKAQNTQEYGPLWTVEMHKLTKYQQLWRKYWDRLDWEACTKQIELFRFRELFPLYLFYVEMINAIVPRSNVQELDEEKELLLAVTTYIKYAQKATVFLREHISVRVKDLDRNSAEAADLEFYTYISNCDYRSKRTRTILWVFLDVWMQNNRPTFFSRHQTNTGMFSLGGRRFFNDMFLFSFPNLTRYYKKLDDSKLNSKTSGIIN
ncbi:hypothetical protein Pst134EA_009396 [Puccinia striiformis f. sp. tritici]|nr:hypothetical protein Pst134EA_009396 [Puccinia striiformis f. sp. tritici]KAH9458158.1 hypothetical protein Pst134EB_010460 [Puccinia striiformis f. sp. tritici]KAH9468867.1 hypothetical protein Pst134EA_009396 [Puccinia striiformis f. sp. tritici]